MSTVRNRVCVPHHCNYWIFFSLIGDIPKITPRPCYLSQGRSVLVRQWAVGSDMLCMWRLDPASSCVGGGGGRGGGMCIYVLILIDSNVGEKHKDAGMLRRFVIPCQSCPCYSMSILSSPCYPVQSMSILSMLSHVNPSVQRDRYR